MSVKSTTTKLGLSKFSRGISVRDTDLADNMDLIDAEFVDIESTFEGGIKVAKGDLTPGLVNTIAFAWQNPESVAIHVLQVVIDVTTAGGTATAVLNVDVVANATATGDTILDGIDLDADAIYSSISAGVSGTNATENAHRADAKAGTNDHVTGKILVEAASALAGKYYIYYVKV